MNQMQSPGLNIKPGTAAVLRAALLGQGTWISPVLPHSHRYGAGAPAKPGLQFGYPEADREAVKVALADLHDRGATLVPCRLPTEQGSESSKVPGVPSTTAEMYDASKEPKPGKSWRRHDYPLRAIHRAVDDGRWIAAIPNTFGCVALDIDDTGGQSFNDASAAVLAAMGIDLPALACLPSGSASRKPNVGHLYFRTEHAKGMHDRTGAKGWQVGTVKGDLKVDGLIRLLDPVGLAQALASTTATAAPVAAELERLLDCKPDTDTEAPAPAKKAKRTGKHGPAAVADAPEGERRDTLNRAVFGDAVNGALTAEREAEYTRAALDAGLPEREIESTIATAKRDGADKRPAGAPADGVVAGRNRKGLMQALERMGLRTRWNSRWRADEFINRENKVDRGDDLFVDDLRETIAEWFTFRQADKLQPLRFSPDNFGRLLNAINNRRRYDPLFSWLEALPEWDGTPRIDGLLTRHFGAPDDSLSAWASRYVPLGALQRAREPGSKLDEVPVLIGPQGIGKSALVKNWIPPEYSEWFGDSLDLAGRQKEQAEAMAGKVIVELGELAGLRRADIETVKAFVSRVDDGAHRPAYGRRTTPSPRMCVFVATSNAESVLPNDPSGNRRWVPVVLAHGCHVEALADRERSQWWSEALHRHLAGERANLPRELMPAARERAEQHRDADSLEERVREYLTGDGIDEITLAELHDGLGGSGGRPADRALQNRYGNALRALHWKSGAVRLADGTVGRRWRPVPGLWKQETDDAELEAMFGQCSGGL